MNTIRLEDENVIDFYSAKLPEAASDIAGSANAIVKAGTDLIGQAANVGVSVVDTSSQLIMQHSLIAGAVGGMLLYALTSKWLYAGLGVVAGFAINSAMDKSKQTTLVTPAGEVTA